MARNVYRKAALDKLSSPEELDQLMQITGPGSWLLLGAFAVVLLAVFGWGILGEIASTVDQTGTLTLSNPVQFVYASDVGQVSELIVRPGDLISQGQVIARITREDEVFNVISRGEGRVLALRANVGEPVNQGTPLISIESFEREIPLQEVILFVSLEDRQRIAPGMDVQVLPSTVERETYGYMEGTVATVSEFAATRQEITTALGETSFVDDLLANSPVFEVRVRLDTGDDGAFVWSASDGPEIEIVSGTPVLVTINVDEKRPISKVLNLD